MCAHVCAYAEQALEKPNQTATRTDKQRLSNGFNSVQLCDRYGMHSSNVRLGHDADVQAHTNQNTHVQQHFSPTEAFRMIGLRFFQLDEHTDDSFHRCPLNPDLLNRLRRSRLAFAHFDIQGRQVCHALLDQGDDVRKFKIGCIAFLAKPHETIAMQVGIDERSNMV